MWLSCVSLTAPCRGGKRCSACQCPHSPQGAGETPTAAAPHGSLQTKWAQLESETFQKASCKAIWNLNRQHLKQERPLPAAGSQESAAFTQHWRKICWCWVKFRTENEVFVHAKSTANYSVIQNPFSWYPKCSAVFQSVKKSEWFSCYIFFSPQVKFYCIWRYVIIHSLKRNR